jgi:hypothetical protein
MEGIMDVLTLLIAIVALVIAIMAFQRTGGIHDLRGQMEDLSEKTEHATKGARDMTADALSRLETFIRGQQKPSSTGHETPEYKPPSTTGQENPECKPPSMEDKP